MTVMTMVVDGVDRHSSLVQTLNAIATGTTPQVAQAVISEGH